MSVNERSDVNKAMRHFQCVYCKNETSYKFAEVIDHCITFHKEDELKLKTIEGNQAGKCVRLTNFKIVPKNYLDDDKIIIPIEETEKIKIAQRPDYSPFQTPKKVLLYSTPKRNESPFQQKHIYNEAEDNQMDIQDDTTDETFEDFLNESFMNLSFRDFKTTDTKSCQTDPSLTVPILDEMTPADITNLQTLVKMLPTVIAILRENGQEDKYIKFNRLLMQRLFPMHNIAYLLFLDVVEWFSKEDSHMMRYADEVKQFWHVGSKLFKGKFLRFMGGWKNQGQQPQRTLDPKSSAVNFVVPDRKMLINDDLAKRLKNMSPRIIQYMIDLINVDDEMQTKTYKLCVDGKKINMGVKNQEMGDINLWGYEGPPTLDERKSILESEILKIGSIQSILECLEKRDIRLVKNMPEHFCESFINSSKDVVCILSKRLKDLRMMKVSKTMTLEKLKKICITDELKNKYSFAISGVKTFLYQMEICIGHILKNIDDLCYVIAEMNSVPNLFCRGSTCDLSTQTNYMCLVDNHNSETEESPLMVDLTKVKQRSKIWSQARSLAKVTGSTLHTALGLNGLKKQQQHYDKFVRSLNPPDFSEKEKEMMKHGSDNEINAVATLVSKFLPVFYPNITYFEEGCYVQFQNDKLFLLVSPDGSGRQVNDSASPDVPLGIEIKCPFPGKIFTTPIYYKMPFYYVIQVLSEMAVLRTSKLLFLSYSSESTSVFRVTFDEVLWKRIYDLAVVLYIEQENHYPRKLAFELNEIRQALKNFCDQNVDFVAELKSAVAQECKHEGQSCGVVRNHCSHIENESRVTPFSTVESTQSLLFEIKENVRQSYSLCRCMASEVLVFLVSDLDRIHARERQYSCPVAYAMKGYSLTTNVLRKMVEELLTRCFHTGLYIPLVSYDGQWYNMALRSATNKPLTMLQLQKDVYKEAKSITKSDFMKHISTSNVVKVSSFIELYDQIVCSIPTNANGYINGPIVVENSKTEQRPITTSNVVYTLLKHHADMKNKVMDVREDVNSEDDSTQRERDSLPHLITGDLDENIINRLSEVQLPQSSYQSSLDVDFSNEIESLFNEPDSVVMDIDKNPPLLKNQSELENEMQYELIDNEDSMETSDTVATVAQNSTEGDSNSMAEDNVSKTVFMKMKNKLNDEMKTAKRRKWKNDTIEQFMAYFNSSATVSNVFTKAELKICLQVIQNETVLPVHFASSWNKEKLVEQLMAAVSNPMSLSVQSKGNRRKKPLYALKTLCLKTISKFPKAIINIINAEILFPTKLLEWQRECPFSFPTTIQELNIGVMWYSKPEYVEERCMHMFHLLDCHHLLTNARVKCCSTGIKESGIHKEAWHKVARNSSNNSSGLSVALVEDLVDKQNNAFAQKTFSKEVEVEMRLNGDVNEANFCYLIRRWYEAEDEPGIPAAERCRRRIEFREWLLSDVVFSHFPPPGTHIKGIPLVMFEGILTNIERRIQVFPFVKRAAYNVRSLGSLEVENLFGQFQDLDPKGSGIIRPDDIPKAISTACELMHARLDQNRIFHMNTSKAKVYPIQDLVQATNMANGTVLLHQDHVNSIAPCDHIFDLPQRRDRNSKRKRGYISEPAMCSRGARPVREFHKIDESKILPHRRLGLEIDNTVDKK